MTKRAWSWRGGLGIATVGALAVAIARDPAAAEPTKQQASLEEERPREAAKVGAPAPDFRLVDTDGVEHQLSDYTDEGKVVVLEWFNPDCPFVRKHHQKSRSMASTFEAFRDRDLVWLAINSGAPGKQGYGRERNAKARRDYGIDYPILLDEKGEVGRVYGAKTTPHMYVIADGILVYRGAIDDNRSAGTLGEKNYVTAALTCVFEGREVEKAETKSYGCSVKYSSRKLP